MPCKLLELKFLVFLGPLVFHNKKKGCFELAGIVSYGASCKQKVALTSNTFDEYDFYSEDTSDTNDTSIPQNTSETTYGVYAAIPKLASWIAQESGYSAATISKLNTHAH